MKTKTFFCCGFVSVVSLLALAANGQNVTRGADVKGADVTGGSVTGGSVTGGSVSGGTVTPGTVTPGTVTPGTVTAVADGREILVSAAEAVSVNVDGPNAEVKIGDQMLTVQKAKLLLDGQPLADMPPEAKKVEVEVKDHLLSVKADGKEVSKSKMK